MKGLVRDLMTDHVTCITTDMSFTQACRLFTSLHIHHLPVKDHNDKLIGMFSATDSIYALNNMVIYKNVKSEDDINEMLKVAEVMTSNKVITLRSDDELTKAIQILQENDLNSIPIVDDGNLIGILTSTDMLKAFRKLIPLD